MEPWLYFQTPVYSFIMPEYLESARTVSTDYLVEIKNEVVKEVKKRTRKKKK